MKRRSILTASTAALVASACSSKDHETSSSKDHETSPSNSTRTNPSGVLSSEAGPGLAPDLRDALTGATSLRLFRIDPARYSTAGTVNALPAEFHGFRILGQTEVADAAASEELLAHVRRGFEESRLEMAACFNPRHGITVQKAGKSVDLLICYECLQVKVFDGGEALHLTSKSVERDVDAFFAARMK